MLNFSSLESILYVRDRSDNHVFEFCFPSIAGELPDSDIMKKAGAFPPRPDPTGFFSFKLGKNQYQMKTPENYVSCPPNSEPFVFFFVK